MFADIIVSESIILRYFLPLKFAISGLRPTITSLNFIFKFGDLKQVGVFHLWFTHCFCFAQDAGVS